MGGSERTPSASAKALGSEQYSSGDYAGAENSFSEAIRLAQPADSPDLHLYFSNRCAARLQLANLNGALEDAKECTKLAPRFAKGWSRLGTCQLQLGRAVAAAESFRRAVDLEPGNSTYRAQLENVRAQLRPPPTPESAQGASRPVPTGPSFTERVTAGLVRQVTAAQGWWLNLSADQQRLIAAGVAVAGVLLLYFIYTWLFGESYYDDLYYYAGGGGGWSWGFWGLVMLAAWRLPPMFGFQPFFGMSIVHFIWLLQMLQNQGGGRRGGFYNPGLTRRRRW